MIVLNLVCRQEHRFEGWFASTGVFDSQQQSGMLVCPICDCAEVSRLPSGPRVLSSSASADLVDSPDTESLGAVQEQLLNALQACARSSENVGERFPEEARKIHYQEAPARNIRGVASRRDARELLDEGIVVLPLPVPPSEETH